MEFTQEGQKNTNVGIRGVNSVDVVILVLRIKESHDGREGETRTSKAVVH